MDAQTYADYISYDMEHAPYDVKGLSEYMKGLVPAGRRRAATARRHDRECAGERIDEAAVRANAWMFSQVLATGARNDADARGRPGAVRAFVEAPSSDSQARRRRERPQGRPPRRARRPHRSAKLGRIAERVPWTKRTHGRSTRTASCCSA